MVSEKHYRHHNLVTPITYNQYSKLIKKLYNISVKENEGTIYFPTHDILQKTKETELTIEYLNYADFIFSSRITSYIPFDEKTSIRLEHSNKSYLDKMKIDMYVPTNLEDKITKFRKKHLFRLIND